MGRGNLELTILHVHVQQLDIPHYYPEMGIFPRGKSYACCPITCLIMLCLLSNNFSNQTAVFPRFCYSRREVTKDVTDACRSSVQGKIFASVDWYKTYSWCVRVDLKTVRTSEKFLSYVPVKQMSVFRHIPQIVSLCGRCKKRNLTTRSHSVYRQQSRIF